MAFINQAVTVLQTLVIALGAGLAVWGVVNLMEGYGNDNPGAKAAGIRALKTVAQTAVATIGTSAVLSEVNWLMVGSASLLAGVLSLLTSLAGIPEECPEEDEGTDAE